MKKIILLCVIFNLLSSFAIAKDETLTYPDGSEYVGQVKDDKPHGKGTYTYSDGSKYTG
ncbi:MAG: MORN repeat-containing protein, partial [Leptospirales bacterium]|nr:MORN repeat-containing protein [Leptospirales bacterium]